LLYDPGSITVVCTADWRQKRSFTSLVFACAQRRSDAIDRGQGHRHRDERAMRFARQSLHRWVCV